jgi:hypothetical protein
MNITDKFTKYKEKFFLNEEKNDVINNIDSVDQIKINNNKQTTYSFSICDDKILYMMESIYEIGKIKTLFKNYFKIQDKILNINEFIQTFTDEKYLFINNMETYLKTTSNNKNKENYLSSHAKMTYEEIVKLLKSTLDDLFSSYKILKQKISKKKGIATKYWNSKLEFFQRKNLNTNNDTKKDTKNTSTSVKEQENTNRNKNNKYSNNLDSISCNNTSTNDSSNNNILLEPPKETWVLKYIPQDTKSADETMNVLNDLSNLVRTFSQKVYHQSEMTNQSKFLFNFFKLK